MLDLEGDRFVRPEGPVEFDFFLQLIPHELIVTGTVQSEVKVLCGRCAGFFSTTLRVSSFLRAYPIQDGAETVELTEDVREDLLLEIPSYPSCSWDGEGICPFSGVDLNELKQPPAPARAECWDELNRLTSAPDPSADQ
ncbi:MAG TPA: hypothetical protein PKE55_11315 [Kiritimatiellia bacterium]|nr:hypothetical protein [Kiritimatiellia bacterium]